LTKELEGAGLESNDFKLASSSRGIKKEDVERQIQKPASRKTQRKKTPYERRLVTNKPLSGRASGELQLRLHSLRWGSNKSMRDKTQASIRDRGIHPREKRKRSETSRGRLGSTQNRLETIEFPFVSEEERKSKKNWQLTQQRKKKAQKKGRTSSWRVVLGNVRNRDKANSKQRALTQKNLTVKGRDGEKRGRRQPSRCSKKRINLLGSSKPTVKVKVWCGNE